LQCARLALNPVEFYLVFEFVGPGVPSHCTSRYVYGIPVYFDNPFLVSYDRGGEPVSRLSASSYGVPPDKAG